MAEFSTDLLNSHYQQFQVYKQDKQKIFISDLSSLSDSAYQLVESQNHQYRQGRLSLEEAKLEAKKALKRVNVGETGYIFAMTTAGKLEMHIAREGENILDEQDENGRHFIREMCASSYNFV